MKVNFVTDLLKLIPNVIIALLTVIIFYADIKMPLGVAGGIPYAILVLLFYLYNSVQKKLILYASLCIVLTYIGFEFSPKGADLWIVITNRIYAIMTILGAMVFSILLSNKNNSLRSNKHNIELSQEKIVNLNNDLVFQRNSFDEHAIVSITDIKGTIKYANRLFCEVSGYTQNELIGQNHRIITSHTHSKAFFEDMWTTLSSGNIWKGTIKNKKKGGGFYYVKTTIVPKLNNQGIPIEYIAIRTEITEQIIAIHFANEHERLATNANKAKSIFLSTMSHELRTPLNAIKGFTEMIKNKTFGDKIKGKNLEYLKYIIEGVERLTTLTNNLLDLSAIENEEYNLEIKCFSITDYIQKLSQEFSHLCNPHNITIDLKTTGNINKFYGDPRSISQIFLNLLTNAIKYSPDGSTITIKLNKINDRCVSLSIEDQGKGFTEKALSHLLEPFKSDRELLTRKDMPSNGLGLYITNKLVNLHNGSLDVENLIDGGAKITARLESMSKN